MRKETEDMIMRHMCDGKGYSDFLAHHGILGQKWGVRRFQNKDGSYTAAGRRRYGIGGFLDDAANAVGNAVGGIFGKKDNPYDHSQSDKSEGVDFLGKLIKDIDRGDVIGIGEDVVRGAQAAMGWGGEAEAAIRKSDLEADPTTGLKLKADTNMSRDDDMKLVNPGYKNFDANTKSNCMLCTITYDMRRRGFDVTANKASYGYQFNDVKHWYPNATVVSSHVQPSPSDTLGWQRTTYLCDRGANPDVYNDVIPDLLAQGEGARGNLMVIWGMSGCYIPGYGCFAGHSMAYEIIDGQVVVFDCQTGTRYEGEALKRLLGSTCEASFARLDNVEYDPEKIKEACN